MWRRDLLRIGTADMLGIVLLAGFADGHGLVRHDESWGLRHSRAATSVFYLFILIATLPGVFVAFQPGLDPSWQYAINYLPSSHIAYGRDLVHHYGPLGFLLVTGELASNVPVTACFWLASQILLGILLWRFRAHFGAVPTSLFALFFLLGFSAGLWAEYQLLLLACLCYSGALLPRGGSGWLSGLGGALCGLSFFVKLSIGVGGLTATALFAAICLFSRSPLTRLLCVATGTHLLTAVMLAFLFFPSAYDLLTWTRLSLEVAAELGVAMSLPGPAAAGGLAALSIGTLTFGLLNPPMTPKATALLFLLPLVLSFKHGFARPDGHMTAFFGLAATLAAVPFLNWDREPRYRVRMILAVGVCLGSALFCGMRFESTPQLTIVGYLQSAAGVGGAKKLASILELPRLRGDMAHQSKRNLEALKLPPSWADRIAAEGADVDSLPWEISIIPANGLRWTPNPAVQIFSAYTHNLDLRVARHFAGGSRPQMLIVRNESIDGRWMLFDAPATWYEILSHYDLIDADSVNKRLLLRTKAQPRLGSAKETHQQTIQFGFTVEVPPGDDLQLVELHFRWNARGVLSKALFRVPQIRIEIETASGQKMFLRLIRATARNGILLRPFAADFEAFQRLFGNLAGDAVVRFRVLQDAPECFQPDIRCVWRTVER